MSPARRNGVGRAPAATAPVPPVVTPPATPTPSPLSTPTPLSTVGLSLALPRARALTDALTAPGVATMSDAELELVRGGLLRDLPPLVDELPPGDPLRLDAYRFALARERPESCTVTQPPFAASPAKCRRAVGLSAVARCVRRRSPGPAPAVADVLADALADALSAGEPAGARPPWWAAWYAGLSGGARAVVEAEAVTWATQLWTAIEWERLERPVVIGGNDDWWDCPRARRLTLRGHADVRLGAGGRPVSLVVGTGVPPPGWRAALGFPALVGALARGERAIPVRVVGLWPASGQVRILPVDAAALADTATAVVSAVATWVDARLEMSGGRVA